MKWLICLAVLLFTVENVHANGEKFKKMLKGGFNALKTGIVNVAKGLGKSLMDTLKAYLDPSSLGILNANETSENITVSKHRRKI